MKVGGALWQLWQFTSNGTMDYTWNMNQFQVLLTFINNIAQTNSIQGYLKQAMSLK